MSEEQKKIRVISYAVSPETAFIIQDYPYGRELRCKKRIWIETKRGFGQRLCYQTTDARYLAKCGVERWNAVKTTTYADCVIMYQLLEDDGEDKAGYIRHDELRFHIEAKDLQAKFERFGEEAFADPYRASFLRVVRNRLQQEAAKQAEKQAQGEGE